jgi:hypothetical protein
LDECYKTLARLHGSRYVKEIDRLLNESVHGFEPEPTGKNTSKQEENIMANTGTVCSKQSIDSVDDADLKCSELCAMQGVNENECPTVKDRCKFFSLRSVERGSKDTVKRTDNTTSIRQKPFQICKKNMIHVALEHRSSPIISERGTVLEARESNNSFCRRNSYPTKSNKSVFEFTNIIPNTTVKDSKRSSTVCETVRRSLVNEGTKEHKAWQRNKLKISVHNISSLLGTTSANSTRSNHLCEYKSSRNVIDSGSELYCAQDAIRECSIHDKGTVKHFKFPNSLQSSTAGKNSVLSSVSQDNSCCQEKSEPKTHTSTTLLPLKVQCTTDQAHDSDDVQTNGFHTGSESSTQEVNTEVKSTTTNEEDMCSDHFHSPSKQLYEHVSPLSSILHSTTNEISHTEEASENKSCNNEKSPKHERTVFISSYDLGCPNIQCKSQLPLQKECVKMDEMYNYYEPMNESFSKNYPPCKPVSPCKSLDRKVSGEGETKYDIVCNVKSGNCYNAYEECRPRDAGISSRSTLATYKDFPLYQAYNFGTVSI